MTISDTYKNLCQQIGMLVIRKAVLDTTQRTIDAQLVELLKQADAIHREALGHDKTQDNNIGQ